MSRVPLAAARSFSRPQSLVQSVVASFDMPGDAEISLQGADGIGSSGNPVDKTYLSSDAEDTSVVARRGSLVRSITLFRTYFRPHWPICDYAALSF